MTILEAFRSAISSLLLNKVRSVLTMLGVIIGVFAVVSLVSMVQGLQNYISDQFNALGSNLVIVTPGQIGSTGDPSRAFSNNKLEARHADLITEYAGKYIVAISPSVRLGKTIKYKTNSYDSTLSGGNEEAAKIIDLPIDKGRFYTKAEVLSKARVVVLGYQVQKSLFRSRNPVGERVSIDGVSYDVIGTIGSKGPNFDDRVYLPDTSIKNDFKIDMISSISIKIKDGVNIDNAVREIRYALLRELKSDDFTVLTQKDILSTVSSILSVLTLALGSIASISLLVGGIGIMNIMLVSVTERTHEIGLRKAVGATSFNIGIQFLFESVVISLLGGSLGLFFGWVLTLLARPYLRAEIPLWAVALALGFSAVVGIGFGTYPAISASKKDAIESLRYE